MVQSAERVDTNTQGFLLSNDRGYETNIRLLVVGMGCGIIIILLRMAPTIPIMGLGRSTSLCNRQFPQFLRPQDPSKTEEDITNTKKKVNKVRKRVYIEPGTVPSLTHMFYVQKGLNNISDGTQPELMQFEPSSLVTIFWPANCPAYLLRLTFRIFKMQHGRGRNVLELPPQP